MGISLPYWDLLIFDDPLLHKWDLIFGNDIITLYWWKKHFLKWHFFLQIPDLYIVILDWYHIWLQETTITSDWYIYNKGFINQETSYWISYGIPKVKCFWTYCYFLRLIILCKYAEWKYWLCIQKLIVGYPLSIWRALIGHEPTHWNFLMFMIKLCSFSDWFLYAFEEELSPIVIIFRHGSINNVMLSHLHCHF